MSFFELAQVRPSRPSSGIVIRGARSLQEKYAVLLVSSQYVVLSCSGSRGIVMKPWTTTPTTKARRVLKHAALCVKHVIFGSIGTVTPNADIFQATLSIILN